ncbi:MAG: DUF1003 domain-containing protein [Coriobacteriia bacterium]|nr:DUF1003 domain-containing protein [Coriobacteriia bacterium]
MSERPRSSWHEQHHRDMTIGQQVADKTALTIGSWAFIIAQTVAVAVWVVVNLTAYIRGWDPYPFILLNLMFSVQAAYAAPIIMMSQNRQAERDRVQAQQDLETNIKAELEIEDVQERLSRMEDILVQLNERISHGTQMRETSTRQAE